MRILCTFPGRAGDLIWALPTMRAIAEFYHTRVDLLVAGEFASLSPLLRQQPYLGLVIADPAWDMSMPAPPSSLPVVLADIQHDKMFHLGYRGWPTLALPFEVWSTATAQEPTLLQGPTVDLTKPWITVDGPGAPCEVAVGFTEAWFELKFGLLTQIDWEVQMDFLQLTPPGSRWGHVPPGTVPVEACDWLEAARAIRNSDLFFGDCSALHVLAVALGKRCVIMEPMEARHNDIFYPLGKVGPQVTLVTGNDGLPTFDSRHCLDALRKALR